MYIPENTVCLRSVTSFLSDSLRSQDCSPSGCSVYGDSPGKILEWVAMPSSRGSSWPRDPTCASCVSGIVGWFFTTEPLSPWGAYLFRKDVTASCYCSVFIQVTHLLNRPGFQSSVCGTQLDPSLWVFRMPLTCGCITKQSTVKFKVTGQGSWWSKVNISIVFSDTEAEFEERVTGKP